MASEVKTNKISPATGTDVTLGDASDTFTIPASSTLDVNGIIDLTGATKTGFPTAGFIGYTVYTGNATWLKSANSPTKVVVEVVGGGGSSGSGTASYINGGSGGSAGYARKYIDVSSVTSSAIVVGAGGVKNAGTSAGASSWTDTGGGGSSTVVGGAGGNGVNATGAHGAGGAGGAASGGDLNMPGGNGVVGDADPVGKITMSSALSSMGGGHLISHVSYGAATVGPAYGGGAGAGRTAGVAIDGADGGVGVVIVWEYA
jgi:hypothetical protein